MASHRTARHKQGRSIATIAGACAARVRLAVIGVARLCTPGARGVFHPQPDSAIVLGVALPADADLDELARTLWWRGLGIVQRDGVAIAGADITVAAQRRRVKQARAFVTRQLRDAGVRGPVKRWQ